MKQRLISLDAVEITVIDEADHMADLLVLPGVTRIVAATPAGGQRLLFSATLDNGVDKLVKRFLRDQASHCVDELNAQVSTMTHHVFHVAGVEANESRCTAASGPGAGSSTCERNITPQARQQLTELGYRPVDLHGNLSSLRAIAISPCSPQVRPGFLWQPISPRAACTSTRSSWWSTSIRPASKAICIFRRTARAGNAGDVPRWACRVAREQTRRSHRRAGPGTGVARGRPARPPKRIRTDGENPPLPSAGPHPLAATFPASAVGVVPATTWLPASDTSRNAGRHLTFVLGG